MRRIVVHIDRVRLRGVRAADKERVVADLCAALVRELAEPGALERLAAMGHPESLRAAARHPALSARPPSLGESAGTTVARVMTR